MQEAGCKALLIRSTIDGNLWALPIMFLQGRVGNPVTNIEASDIKIHISGGEVKLRNDGPDASGKGNMFSVSKDADRQGS